MMMRRVAIGGAIVTAIAVLVGLRWLTESFDTGDVDAPPAFLHDRFDTVVLHTESHRRLHVRLPALGLPGVCDRHGAIPGKFLFPVVGR